MAKENQSKLPPQNEDVEKSLLGCLMIDPNAIIKIADNLDEKDFYKKKNKEIYSVISELFNQGEAIDFLTVTNRLKEKNQLEAIGGRSYLTEVVNSVPTAGNVETYAKIVRRKGVLRDLIEASQIIGSIAYKEEDQDTDIILDEAEKTIFDIAQRSLKQRFYKVDEGLSEAQERLEKLSRNDGTMRGVATGFNALDNKLAGLQKSDLVVLAARPSMGKSSLALNIAMNAAMKAGAPVGIFSLEMGKDQLIDRFISTQSRVDLWKLRTGRLNKDERGRVQEAMKDLTNIPIYMDDTSGINVLQMKAMARRLQSQSGLGLIIVDYLQLINPRNANLSMVQQMTEISKALKGMARELNIPVLALSQLSRAVEQRSPQIPRLSDLRETGAIEQDADVVLFIYREDRYNERTTRKGIADLIIAKHRNGPVGKAELYFDENRATFCNLDTAYQTDENVDLEYQPEVDNSGIVMNPELDEED